MKANWDDAEVMDAIEQASKEATDDCMYEGVILLGSILLEVDEEDLRNALERRGKDGI